FVSRFSSDGANLDFSTYLGGGGDDQALAIAVDGAAQVYLTGATNSIDFPVLNAVQATRGGANPQIPILDAFVTKLDTNGAGLIYSTYLGGNGSDLGNGVATDGMNAYVTGQAFSSDFPTTPNPLRATGFNDSFIAKIAVRADLVLAISDLPDPVMV